jgi:phosphoribosylformimino-5-aminoimidazole carboxamide ribotide isomerase
VLIIPAIDVKDGRCVRLYQGEMDKETVYFENPVEAAKHWVEQGAELIHIVDLNGAVAGHPVHEKEISAICEFKQVLVQLGGGLRSLRAVERAFELGVDRIILGTAAYKHRDFFVSVCMRFPGKIVAGIDGREGKVAIEGWREATSMDPVELARRCEEDGASRIIYTDIRRDGTSQGVNVEATSRLARAVKIPIIASGGVGSLEDIRRLKKLEKDGVEGVIVGRALYNGAFTLSEAIGLGNEP